MTIYVLVDLHTGYPYDAFKTLEAAQNYCRRIGKPEVRPFRVPLHGSECEPGCLLPLVPIPQLAIA
ncbi:MAG: hypothetical protein ACFB4I_17555 [Cyanophyceae cyanobacterium]